MKRILIVGATSAIARSCAREWAITPASFFLVARKDAELKATADDLIARGSKVETFNMDVTDVASHKQMLDMCVKSTGQIDIALIAHGTLPDQQECQTNVDRLINEFNINGLSTIALMTVIANHLELQKHGSLAVISSVAGDRGRPSNYLYGSAKAAVSVFSEGLQARMYKLGVSVSVIKPGFVNTPMTQHLSLPKLLLAEPQEVAKAIVAGIEKKKNVIYTPSIWRLIMLIIKTIPNFIFKRINL
ncbi:SDR family oxidoreductase [Pseudomonas syringae group sp. J309-1]|uniref:SDR family oxidoreductase n=1 Tax=Pseudomonas syringae group sp. J309-1 TaxID=3079588 RepID=UPI0021096563|nr:SDR family oxidoreductase [Pseudomonas syringae group sp. J309-1]MCQ2999050.1 SDR family oxidoreductase [Pseudomonas syringae]MDU8361883.1 SDR family oxidoreductase [Pseudomonas syringae group sp. J309-1]